MEPLPAGFEISKAPPIKPSTDDETPTKHYIITDGLSSLSVFVSPLSSASPQGFVSKQGVQLNSGALNVISRKKDNYLITVVGEVPESTLKSVIESLRRTMKGGNTP
jgi:sigma-E factor negative regulatory protein RseB